MSFRGGEIEFCIAADSSPIFFFGFLDDVVTRQTKQLPPKSLQIKGAFAHDEGGGRKKKTNHHRYKRNVWEIAAPRRGSIVRMCLVVLAKLSARCGNSGTMQSGVKSGHATATPI